MDYQRERAVLSGESVEVPKPRLFDEVRRRLRLKHYSLATERAYLFWIRGYILFSEKRHPRDMGGSEVERYLSHLAVTRDVAASTQNQALSALLFLYREVLGITLPWMDGVVRAKRPRRLPVVLSVDEVHRLLAAMDGRAWSIASLLYGTGMRLMEGLRLRIKDVDFTRFEITVREGKGNKDRRTLLPRGLVEPLGREIERARVLHAQDLTAGWAWRDCHMRSVASIQRPAPRSAGSSSFLHCSVRAIHWMACFAGTIWMERFLRAHCAARVNASVSSNRSARTC